MSVIDVPYLRRSRRYPAVLANIRAACRRCSCSAENWRQLFIPIGFAHGFVTLEPNTQVLYKVTSPYAPPHDRGLAFDDPDLAIDWPVGLGGFTLSEREQALGPAV